MPAKRESTNVSQSVSLLFPMERGEEEDSASKQTRETHAPGSKKP